MPRSAGTVLPNGMAPGGPVINQSITIDARGADAGVEQKIRDALDEAAPYILRQASKQEDDKRKAMSRSRLGGTV